MSRDILEKLLPGMNIVVLECLEDGSFSLLSPSPGWFDSFFPGGRSNINIKKNQLPERFFFLETFLIDSHSSWNGKNPGILRSGLWSETNASGEEYHLEASACLIDNRKILLIKCSEEEFHEKQELLQKAREKKLYLDRVLKAEDALRRSEEKTRALLNAIPDLMLRIDKAHHILDCKFPEEFKLFSSTGEIIGKKVFDVLPTDMASRLMHYIDKLEKTGVKQLFEIQLTPHGKIRDYEVRIVKMGADQVLVMIRDISKEKKSERLKREFISMVSHELRTPLTSIHGALGLIAGGVAGQLQSNVKKLMDIALNNSERLISLINDILDIEKIESGKMSFIIKPLNIVSLVEQSIESNKAYADRFKVTFRINIDSNVHERETKVKGDYDRLVQVMTNLLSNAAKFSPTDEVVIISVERFNRTIRVSVKDKGPGIPGEFYNRIFQKFAQADSSDTRQKGGTGLGLSISRAIIEKLGGKIGFESEIGKGATFYFELPEEE